MSDDETLQRVRECVIATFRLPASTPVTRETTSADVDGWDSLSHAMLIMRVEEHFGIELPIDAVIDLANVGELTDLVRATLGSNAPAP